MHIIEEIRYRQLQPYGCGLYSIANLFVNVEDNSIYNDTKLEESKNGNTMYQLNQWINHLKLFVEPVYYNSFEYLDPEHRLPKSTFDMRTDEEGAYLPMLFEGKRTEKSKYHLVSALVDYNGAILVYDSLLLSPYWTSFEKLINGTEFYHLRGVWLFCHQRDGSWATFNYESNA